MMGKKQVLPGMGVKSNNELLKKGKNACMMRFF